MKEYRLIIFNCQECGLEVRVLIKRNGILLFSILDKLYSGKDVINKNGNYVCVNCKISNLHINFQFVYN